MQSPPLSPSVSDSQIQALSPAVSQRDPGGVQTSAADSKGMEVEPSRYESLSQVSALTKTEKKKIVADTLVQ